MKCRIGNKPFFYNVDKKEALDLDTIDDFKILKESLQILMKILIFGGSGFLGKNLANYLQKSKHKITIFDKNIFKRNKKINFIQGNILNYKKV